MRYVFRFYTNSNCINFTALIGSQRKRQIDETLVIGKEQFSQWSRKGRSEKETEAIASKRRRMSVYVNSKF